MAAPPPHSAPHQAGRRPSTSLSAVFRRLGGEAPARPAPPPAPASRPAPPPSPPRPVPPPSPPRQLLGFAEAVAVVPRVEEFLPTEEDVAAGVETPPEPEPEPATVPEPGPPEQARVRELPPDPPTPLPPEPPAAPAQPRPQNLVGRLGRRLGDAPAAASAPAMPEPGARHRVEPPPAPSPAAGERTGRPSLPRNRRAYRRAKLPAEMEINGAPCTLIDVSIGGFAASGVPPIEPNALVPVTIRLVIDGIEVGTQLSARIIYVTQGRSAGRFVELSPSQMAFLRYIVTWRGESVGAIGTTTLLDAIAGGADRSFVPGSGDPSDPEAKSRWWAGLIGKKVNPPR